MNRRSILGMLAGAPAAAPVIAESVLSGVAAPSHPYPFGAGAAGMNVGQLAVGTVQEPRMNRPAAMRLIFGDAGMLAKIRDELFEQNRFIQTLDPDIAAKKSWSTMAKVAFQRQRNVECALLDLQDERRRDRPGYFLQVVEDQLSKLMWGESRSPFG